MPNFAPELIKAEGEGVMPRYPVFIPSKARWQRERARAARWLTRDGVPFFLVVEPQEQEQYSHLVPPERLLVLPKNDGGLVYVRNWIVDYSVSRGDERHWQLDDNTFGFYRYWKGRRLPCRSGIALRVCEDLTDRYENVGVSGLNYNMFVVTPTSPMAINAHVYSCTLFNNAIPYRFRGTYNEDVDMCLQVLTSGKWCTIQLSAFSVKKVQTGNVSGGNDTLYQGDGRLRMARALERAWPGVVTTQRRFKRPQHVIIGTWQRFDTPLRLKPGVDLSALPAVNEYGMELRRTGEVKSEQVKRILAESSSRFVPSSEDE